MSEPESSAFSKSCIGDSSLLLVIDIQERLAAAMPSKVLNRVLLNTQLLVSSAQLLDVPTITTEQYPRGLGPTHPSVRDALAPGSPCVTKMTFSCCASREFSERLAEAERSQIVISGMEAHICVLQTALDLKSRGFNVFVVEDAICSRRLENYQNALDRLRQCDIAIVSAESVVFEWLGSAEHEHFKSIQSKLR